MRRSFALVLLLGLAHLGSTRVVPVVAAQDEAGAPRFLIAARQPSQRPTPVDVATVPALRQRISLKLESVSRAEALAALARASSLQFVYANGVVPREGRVRLKADEITVAAALTEVLMGAGVDVVIAPGGSIVLVKQIAVAAPSAGRLQGRVTDAATGRPLPQVEVLLEGTKWKTTTDTAGWYRLVEIDTGSYTLTARRVAYAKQSRKVLVRAEQDDTVNFALSEAAVALDELVTTATGQQRRRDLGNSITTIRADSVLQSAPIRSLTDLLEDRVPGLTTQHTSGAPGDPSKLRLRGLGSMTRSNDPVVIVDGIRIYAAQADVRSGNLTNQAGISCHSGNAFSGVGPRTCVMGPGSTDNIGLAGNPQPAPSPLDQIDPNIIEKIEVFKGPSAATLYGADAANGVIVVTTKKGRPGPTLWTASVIHGRTVIPGRWPDGYYRWGSIENSPSILCPLITVECDADSVASYQALNDPSMTLMGKGRRTAVSLSASGGNQGLTYSVTGSYSDETGLLELPAFLIDHFRSSFNSEAPDWMRRPHHLKEWSVTSNVMARVGPTANITLSTTLKRTEQQRSELETLVPIFAGLYVNKTTGEYWTSGDIGNVIRRSTAADLGDFYTQTTASAVNFTAGLSANWQARPWFTVSGQTGINVIPRHDRRFRPTGMPLPADSGMLVHGTGRSLVGTANLQGSVRKPLGWGFDFLTSVGANLNTMNTTDVVASAAQLISGTSAISGARLITATNAELSTSVYGWYIEPRIVGQRLSLSTGFRLDGGSTYGTRITGGVGLPKFNGSWVISEEPFFPFKSLFSSFRLRGAYGQAQTQPGPTDRLRLYTGRPEDRLRLTDVGNTELRPERSKEVEGGFDADLLDGRISVELTAYQKNTIDALVPFVLPPSVHGGGTVMQNLGNTRNRGIDLTLGLTPVQTPLLTWRANLIYNNNSNTLMKLGKGVLPNKEAGIVEGYPVNGRWARPILGYADHNGNGVLEPAEIQVGDSLVFMGRIQPAYTTALHSDVTLFGGAIGVSAALSYESGMLQVDQTARKNWTLVRALSDPNAPPGEQAAVLASLKDNTVSRTDYGLMQDISMFRFKSLSVRYNAPSRVARLFRAQTLSVAVQGSNLGLHSTYRGKDPDVNSWSAGEGVTDTGQLPQPRTWQLSFNLQY